MVKDARNAVPLTSEHRASPARRVRIHVLPGLPDLSPVPRSLLSPADTANAAEMRFRDPAASKCQVATGFS
jgi:hypothetical protein